MNAILERLREAYKARSRRERLIIQLIGAAFVLFVFYSSVISPLRESVALKERKVLALRKDIEQSILLSNEIVRLQLELESVQQLVSTRQQTNLLTLLETLAEKAGVKDQLESVKPANPSKNDRYPETRVDVKLSGATLAQAVNLLHEIETADLHLIIRSVAIQTRRDDTNLLEIKFAVSSFEKV